MGVDWFRQGKAAELASLTAPTLVLKGEGKRFFPIANVTAHARQ
jgi:hypothetical protein